MKKFLTVLLFIVFLVPIISFAVEQPPSRLVPCDGPDCNFQHLVQLVSNVIKYIVYISVPIATIVIAWAGFILMTTGVSDKRNEAKGIIKKVLIGFVFILGAWLIVDTILSALLKDNFKNIIEIR